MNDNFIQLPNCFDMFFPSFISGFTNWIVRCHNIIIIACCHFFLLFTLLIIHFPTPYFPPSFSKLMTSRKQNSILSSSKKYQHCSWTKGRNLIILWNLFQCFFCVHRKNLSSIRTKNTSRLLQNRNLRENESFSCPEIKFN